MVCEIGVCVTVQVWCPECMKDMQFNLLQTLNLTADEAMSFKRTRKLLEKGNYQSFYKMQITMRQIYIKATVNK